MKTTSNSTSVRPVAVVLADFKGQTTRVDLSSAAVLLCGMNGRGKTTILEALHLAFAGTLPGYRASQMDVSTLQGLAGPSGRWAVGVEMSDGGTIRREFLGVQTRIRVSIPGVGILADRNDDHEAALISRYGDWSLTLNLADLTTMTPDALKAFVLDLCARAAGGAAAWSSQQVCEALRTRVPAIGDVQADEGADGPVAQLDLLDEQLAGALTDCRRDIRDANTRRRVEVPEAFSGDLVDAESRVTAAEAMLADLQRRKGARDAEVAQAAAMRQAADAEVIRLEAVLTEARKSLAGVGVDAAVPSPTEPAARQARDVLAAAAPQPPAWDSGLTEAARDGLNTQVQELQVQAAAGAELVKGLGRRVKEIRDRIAKYSDGICPECGQPAASHIEGLEAEARSAAEELRQAAETQAEVSHRITEVTAARDEAVAAVEKYKAAAASHARKLADAEKALVAAISADERAGRDVELANAEKRRVRAVAQARLDEASAALVLAREAATGPWLDGSDEVLDSDHAAAAAELNLARADLEELRRQDHAAREAVASRDKAEADHTQFQEWQTTLKLAIDTMQAIRREVIGAYVDPLVSRVNEFTGGYLGTFEARFAPRFALGFRRGDGDGAAWIPLQRLSKGEFALAAIALAWALCELRRPPMRLVAMDDIEHLDMNNLPAFLGAVAANAVGSAEGGFDLVILAGRGGAVEYRPVCTDGIEIVDLDGTAVSGAATAA